ncbi:MgtC/SapB family protein [Leucobacter insecticola]|uniref:MgtC/SapB family protein n=1 Tax=Leucobacter insecticola TaxID=2714934 RepID=A0A6G8FK45_9MICO|nr:MgtC/SapB family protein [Leucobacter insecticola]QIM16731.1 MgtC/SapB family protein [Leucobacter insecticola]
MIDWIDITLRIGASISLGALIGIERQWRSRTAGIRTNALVSLGAALFVIMGAYSFSGTDADPTRVAAQIVSGIGFLGAGVIMKQGASISGLNTAATLWASAAVGALAGGGLMWIAAVGTVTIMAANTLLRPLGRLLDRRVSPGFKESTESEYTFEVRCMREHEVTIRAAVFRAVHRPELVVKSIAATDLPEDVVVISAIVHSAKRNDSEIEQAIAEVIEAPEVLSVRWSADDLSGVD